MATKGTESGVYRVTEIIGTSTVSWDDIWRGSSTKQES
jgi:flavin-binding protein dodecin